MRLEGEPSLCGKLLRLDNVTLDAIMTDGCVAAVDGSRLCRVTNVRETWLRSNQLWFEVKDGERY